MIYEICHLQTSKARSRRYRRQFLQPNTPLKALDEMDGKMEYRSILSVDHQEKVGKKNENRKGKKLIEPKNYRKIQWQKASLQKLKVAGVRPGREEKMFSAGMSAPSIAPSFS